MGPDLEFITMQDGVRLRALRWGDARRRALVLLHGGGANAHWWDHLAPRLADEWHVVALDLRGHGDSDRPPELENGDFERDLGDVVTSLSLEAPTLIGHSMGAAIALRYASERAESSAAPRALILVDPARGGNRRSSRRLRLALTLGRGYASAEEAVERFRFVPDSEHASEALRRYIAERSVRRNDEGSYEYKFDARWFAMPPRERPDFSQVRIPTLVLRGVESQVLTEEGLGAWRDDLPHARFVEIEGAGHHLQLDRPEATLDAVEDFLAEVEAATAR